MQGQGRQDRRKSDAILKKDLIRGPGLASRRLLLIGKEIVWVFDIEIYDVKGACLWNG